MAMRLQMSKVPASRAPAVASGAWRVLYVPCMFYCKVSDSLLRPLLTGILEVSGVRCEKRSRVNRCALPNVLLLAVPPDPRDVLEYLR